MFQDISFKSLDYVYVSRRRQVCKIKNMNGFLLQNNIKEYKGQ